MNVPNSITIARLVLVPVFAWLFLAGAPTAALVVFAVAAISDGIDGLLARLLDQRTALGAILDPLADKLLGLTALVLLAAEATLPVWFLVAALLRDSVVLGVGLTSRLAHQPLPAAPTRVSKYATFLLMGAVTLALASRMPGFEREVEPWAATVGALAAECLLVASVQYGLLWHTLGRRLRQRGVASRA